MVNGVCYRHKQIGTPRGMQKKTVTINGIVYDVASGKPIAKSTEGVVARHTVTKFAPAEQPKPAPKPDIPPVRHPMVAKAHAAQAQAKLAQKRVPKSAQTIKEQAIREAMEQPTHSRKQITLKKQPTRLHRTLRTTAIALGALFIGGYIAYLNMPAITTGIAAAQSGVHATFPSYTPNGYAIAGPVTADNGIVTIRFDATAAPVSYTIQQQRSDWDSSAVLENYITPNAGNDYLATQANGLTIYTYTQSAAWVNGGILYTIHGNAPLSADQIEHIAISM